MTTEETPGRPRPRDRTPRAQLVPLTALRTTFLLRIDPLRRGHVDFLKRVIDDIPPIVVQRRTFEVVDGVHRLQAAKELGLTHIRCHLIAGDEMAALLAGIHYNAHHGLPLSLRERQHAAARLLALNPTRSDRWIAAVTGLSPAAVAAVRTCSIDKSEQSNATAETFGPPGRLGRDGRVRPLSAAVGKTRALELFQEQPGRAIREVARLAGISVGTAHAVKKCQGDLSDTAAPIQIAVPGRPATLVISRMSRDPSVIQTEAGRGALRRLRALALNPGTEQAVLDGVPRHYAGDLIALIRESMSSWNAVTRHLDEQSTSLQTPRSPNSAKI